MLEILCRRCQSVIRINMEDKCYRFEKCPCRAVLVEVRPPLSTVFEFASGAALILACKE